MAGERHKASGLDRTTAEKVAKYYRRDKASVEIVEEGGGKFTVIATYED